MNLREIRSSDYRAVCEGVLQMQRASSLDETTWVLVRTAMEVVPCDHGGYSEVDTHFCRFEFFSSVPEITDWAQRRDDVWNRFLPTHPVLRFRTENPDTRVVLLSERDLAI